MIKTNFWLTNRFDLFIYSLSDVLIFIFLFLVSKDFIFRFSISFFYYYLFGYSTAIYLEGIQIISKKKYL